jgi:hypothetical protein
LASTEWVVRGLSAGWTEVVPVNEGGLFGWLAFWGRAIWFSLQVWQREQGAASIVKEMEVFGGPPSGFAFRRCGGEAEVVEDAAEGVWVGNGGDHLEPPIAAGAF